MTRFYHFAFVLPNGDLSRRRVARLELDDGDKPSDEVVVELIAGELQLNALSSHSIALFDGVNGPEIGRFKVEAEVSTIYTAEKIEPARTH